MFTSLEKWQKAPETTCTRSSGRRCLSFLPAWICVSRRTRWALTRGNRLPEVPTDRLGVKRPAGRAADIGPYEIASMRRFLEKPKAPRNSPISRWT